MWARGTGNTTAPGDDPGWNNVSIRVNGTSEAQAVAGDFGGAVFAKHGGQWQAEGCGTPAVGGRAARDSQGERPQGVFHTLEHVGDCKGLRT